MPRLNPLIFLAVIFTFYFRGTVFSQNATIVGSVRDIYNVGIGAANVIIPELGTGTTTNEQGYYELKVPSGKKLVVRFSYFSSSKEVQVRALNPGETFRLNVVLNSVILNPYEVTEKKDSKKESMTKVDPRVLEVMPVATDKTIAVVKTMPGVSSISEMSSTYSVRGGNFDENLVYINDIEVFRPFLVRAGQQEGLSIINSDLVDDIRFSAGGFEARYGDKLSSVLDIKYKIPKDFHGSFSANLLGFSGHVEGVTKNKKFSYLIGARQHSNSYLLKSMDVQGDFKSSFTDVQSYFTYYINRRTTLSYFSYFGNNLYKIIPQTQETDYGTMNLVLRLKVYFDGQELTTYRNFLNALDFTYHPQDSLKLKLIFSAYTTSEKEYYDIMGQYWLAQVDTDPGSDEFGKAKNTLGVGTFLNHARNSLDAMIYNVEHKGIKTYRKSELKWGLKAQYEDISDKLREWQMMDSADYSVPINPGKLELSSFMTANIQLNSFRYSGYVQNTFTISDSNSMYLTTGIRANYWDYNNEFFATPRVQFYFEPNRKHNLKIIRNKMPDSLLKRNMSFSAAVGMYYQPAFYRELRDFEGVLNPEIRAQKSYQAVLATEIIIKLWDRPFKWKTEAYYKYLTDIIPYDVEDVRVRYYAKNNAVGYAAGIDMMLYGEFLPNLPSWISASLMSTREDVDGDNKGYVPRPTDQRFRVAVFFQDLLPNNPTSKVHLNFVYGTPLPFGPPQRPNLRNEFRMRAYRRVDVGFSKLVYSMDKNHRSRINFLNKFTSVWLSGEIFNMFGVDNTISYFWVKDVNSNLWGVPNYLTGRRFNVSLSVKF